jgi:hypothetical protein
MHSVPALALKAMFGSRIASSRIRITLPGKPLLERVTRLLNPDPLGRGGVNGLWPPRCFQIRCGILVEPFLPIPPLTTTRWAAARL